MAWWEAEIEPRNRVKVAVDRLSFDRQNPRFTPEKRPDGDSDSAFIAELAASADLAELIESISASGYIDIEPLIVMGRGDELVVLEGNRRLAALKSLRNLELAKAAKVSVPPLSTSVLDTLNEVSVYRIESEDEARTLIGFKHINGPQTWDAYAKARYAARWLDDERRKGAAGLSLVEIARRMGDTNDTIHRIVTAVYVLEQAQERGLFDVADRATKNFSFSHLYTALTYPEYRSYLGIAGADRSADPSRNAVPESHSENLRRVLVWLYGSKSEAKEPAIRRQNPDLARLKRVLGDPRSLRVMLERNNLDEAVESAVSSAARFEGYLVEADANLKGAQSALDGYDGTDSTMLEIANGVLTKARTIHRTMQSLHAEQASTATSNDLFSGISTSSTTSKPQ